MWVCKHIAIYMAIHTFKRLEPALRKMAFRELLCMALGRQRLGQEAGDGHNGQDDHSTGGIDGDDERKALSQKIQLALQNLRASVTSSSKSSCQA